MFIASAPDVEKCSGNFIFVFFCLLVLLYKKWKYFVNWNIKYFDFFPQQCLSHFYTIRLEYFPLNYTMFFSYYDNFVVKITSEKDKWTSLNSRDRDSKNMLEYIEFAYKKNNNHCKLEDGYRKKAIFSIAFTQIGRWKDRV